MKHIHTVMLNIVLVAMIMILPLSSCATVNNNPIPVIQPTVTGQPALPNPASQYCKEQGNKSEFRTATDGSQNGICIFPDGSECDEWTYFRKECGPVPQITITPTLIQGPSNFSSAMIVTQEVQTPAGVILGPGNSPVKSTDGLFFYSPDGLVVGQLQAPNADQVHAGGRFQGILDFPLVFQAFDPETLKEYLAVNHGKTTSEPLGKVTILTGLDDKAKLAGLVGVPAEPIIFYSFFQPAESVIETSFMLGGVDTIATVSPILTLESSESRYWKPVAIQMKNDQPSGLWFTRTPWGIGGEIVFTPNEGLIYFDNVSGTYFEVLPEDNNFSSLSPDQTWITYSIRKETRSALMIRNLAGGTLVEMPLMPESDRGAGNGVFSPTNTFIAWSEAQGSLSESNFHQTIRVATTDGKVIGSFDDTLFNKNASIRVGNSVKPVGWLNNENLLVQVIDGEKPHDGTLVKVNIATGQSFIFSKGYFSGLFYH